MILLLLVDCAIRLAQQAPSPEPAPSRELLVFHPGTETGGEQQVVQTILDAAGKGARATLHEDTELAGLAGPDAGRDQRLQAYHAMRRAKAHGTWTITFVRPEGVVTIETFDDEQGVRAVRGARLRSMSRDRLSDEHLVRLEETVTALRRELADKIAFLAASPASPYQETVAWQQPKAPPHPGFRWAFSESGPRATNVYETSSLEKAGLKVGDLIVTLNGQSVRTPPQLGRSLGPLHAGEALKLEVLRGAKTVALDGRVESCAELIPRWQQGVVGKKVPHLVASIGAPPLSLSDLAGRVILEVVYDPALPETREGFGVLRWIRDHYPEDRVVIVGVATNADARKLGRLLDELKPGWPSAADPVGEMTDSLRVYRPPAYLLIDGQGVLRFRQVEEARLRQAIDTLAASR